MGTEPAIRALGGVNITPERGGPTYPRQMCTGPATAGPVTAASVTALEATMRAEGGGFAGHACQNSAELTGAAEFRHLLTHRPCPLAVTRLF